MPAQLGMIASQAAQAGLGMVLQRYQDKRQYNMQRKLQDLQIKGQEHMAESNYQRQLRLWKETNYPAQMEQLKLAGLNPGLMYGMGGGGGTTAAAQPGNVTGGQAPTGAHEITAMMGMGIQRELLQAQKENIEANTEKTKVEAAKAGGVDTKEAEARIQGINQEIQESIARIAKTSQEIKNLQAQEQLTGLESGLKKLQTDYEKATLTDRVQLINTAVDHADAALKIIENDKDISDATKQTHIRQIKANLAQTLMQTQLINIQKNLTSEQITTEQHRRGQIAAQIVQGSRHLDIEKFRAETDRSRQYNDAQGEDPLEKGLNKLGFLIPLPGFGKGQSPVRGFHDRR